MKNKNNSINQKYANYNINKLNPLIKGKDVDIFKLDFGMYLVTFKDTIDKGKIKRSQENKEKLFLFESRALDRVSEKKDLIEDQIVEIDGISGVLVNNIRNLKIKKNVYFKIYIFHVYIFFNTEIFILIINISPDIIKK